MDFLDQLFYWLDKLALLAFPPLLLNFFFIFPQKKRIIHDKKRVALFYIPGLVLLLANVLLNVVLESRLTEAQVLTFQKILEKLELVHFALYSLLALVLIIRDLISDINPYIKNQLKWIAVGLGLGSLPFAIFMLPLSPGPSATTRAS